MISCTGQPAAYGVRVAFQKFNQVWTLLEEVIYLGSVQVGIDFVGEKIVRGSALFNQIGVAVRTMIADAEAMTGETGLMRLDLSGLQRGYYFLRMERPGERPVTKALVVENRD